MKNNTVNEVREFKIEQGVPMTQGRGPKALKYPWREMKVGDSVFIPDKTPASLRTSIDYAKWKMESGTDFKARTVEGGVRVWRTA